METHKDFEERHFKGQLRFEPMILDNTAIMGYKTCPTYYNYVLVLGYRPKIDPPYFSWGSSIHKFIEIVEKSIEENMALRLKKGLKAAKNKLISTKPEIKPNSKYSFVNEERLQETCLRLFKWWLEEKEHSKVEVLAVEQPFNVEIAPDIFIGGRADQIIQVGSDIYGRDWKTTGQQLNWFFSKLKPDHQFFLYTLAESIVQNRRVHGQVIVGIYNEKTKGPEIKAATVNYTQHELNEETENLLWWIDKINDSRKRDLYPKNERACWNCPFRIVCKAESDMGKLSILKSRFQHKPWDHTKV